MTSTVGELIEAGARRLDASGSSSARLDAQLLLGYVTGWSRTEMLAHPERVVATEPGSAFQALVARREAAEPIAYLLGEREFYGRVFNVDRRALIPRPETELLVELGIAAVARFRAAGIQPRVVDVGTGCGAIAISVAAEAKIDVLATDISADALALASENADRLLGAGSGATGRRAASLTLVETDLLAGLSPPLHIVLANLPYIPSGLDLPPEVHAYEPNVALFGGERGTELIEKFLTQARLFLAPHAEMALELDEQDQATPIADLARTLYPAAEVSVCQDGGGYDRVVRIVT